MLGWEERETNTIFIITSVLNMQCKIMYIPWIQTQRSKKPFAAYLGAESLRNNNLLNSSPTDE